ncbi:hypothetical protein HMN09_01079100 [Mycena chlorophos]|uniref:F-box domain-containing protein n=1 Tax=Mycena chlorophos TaxID=658473 RepID=A0A8H6SDE8_MYCCL|nr:hypothetical protein HMN09_01079100 [Mycena chlorophos]
MATSSPFASKLGTNYSPTQHEVAQLHALLAEPTHRLQLLDAQIAQIQKTLDDAFVERERLAAYVDEYKALLSPIRRVPEDVLREIFVACLPTDRNCFMSATEPPLLLGRVCSQWRHIAQTTPALWARLHFVDPSATAKATTPCCWQRSEQWLDAALSWLKRSGQRPLSISLYGADKGLPLPDDEAAEKFVKRATYRFIQALVPLSRRWEQLQLVMPKANLSLLRPLRPADVPLLKSLILVDDGINYNQFEDPNDWDEGCRLALLGGPQLERFSVNSIGLLTRRLPLKWANLLELRFDGTHLDGDEMLTVLSQCPRLVTGNFAIGIGETTFTTALEIPTLKHLTLRMAWSTTSLAFLGMLYLPNLSSIALTTTSLNPELTFDAPAAACFFASMQHSLERVAVFPDAFPDASISALLKALPPSVTTLELCPVEHPASVNTWGLWNPAAIRSPNSFDTVLSTLLPSSLESETQACPNLHTFKLASAHTSGGAVVQLVRARRQRLKRVDVTFEHLVEVDVEVELRELVQEGLALSVKQPPPIRFFPRAGLE